MGIPTKGRNVKKIKVNKWDTILIKWLDAASSPSWRDHEGLGLTKFNVNTVGMFLGEDDDHWAVCMNHGTDSGRIADTMQIPKGMITHVEILKRAKTI